VVLQPLTSLIAAWADLFSGNEKGNNSGTITRINGIRLFIQRKN
jgi:hypothetical protein